MKKNRKPKPVITPPLDTFQGVKLVKLEPMTKQREVVAAEMGMRYGWVPRYIPQYYLRDTIIGTWIRTIPVEPVQGKAWSVDRAEVEPQEAMKEALRWAAKVGIGVDTKGFSVAWPIFMATMKQIKDAKGEPVIEEGEGSSTPPDTTGEL